MILSIILLKHTWYFNTSTKYLVEYFVAENDELLN